MSLYQSPVFLPRQGKGKMSTYWLIGHKNYSVQNDSLVCHWNPNMARKKKPVAGSEVSVGNVSSTSSIFCFVFVVVQITSSQPVLIDPGGCV